MNQNVMTRPATARPACDPATRVTKSLLGYGVLAGPCYVLVVLGQALARPGFSLVRDDASRLLTARTQEALRDAAGARDIPLVKDEPADYDFDRIRAWCVAPDGTGIDCSRPRACSYADSVSARSASERLQAT